MRPPGHAVALLSLMVLLAGCGSGSGSLQIADGAVQQGARVVGNKSVTAVKLSTDDVTRLADQARVSEDVIREVAPQLDNQSVWQRSLSGVQTVYQQTPAELRGNLVGLACDGMNGEIATQQQLAANVQQRFQVNNQDELTQLVHDVVGLWQDLYEARNSGDPDLQAAAVLACFTVEAMVG